MPTGDTSRLVLNNKQYHSNVQEEYLTDLPTKDSARRLHRRLTGRFRLQTKIQRLIVVDRIG